eukprot:1689379-Pyramimonas_sp.AAC.1
MSGVGRALDLCRGDEPPRPGTQQFSAQLRIPRGSTVQGRHLRFVHGPVMDQPSLVVFLWWHLGRGRGKPAARQERRRRALEPQMPARRKKIMRPDKRERHDLNALGWMAVERRGRE